jgi:hypothetical protein
MLLECIHALHNVKERERERLMYKVRHTDESLWSFIHSTLDVKEL